MPTRDQVPTGAPCWVDLWTSDTEAATRFYGALFGWEVAEPDPQFGGYFNFTRKGEWIAGCMGDMGDMKANDAWKVYLSVDDVEQSYRAAVAAGAVAFGEPMAVAELGTQFVFADPSGASLGAWQPGSFTGFSTLGEHGSPAWFELVTSDYQGARDFYARAFSWNIETMADTPEFRYSTMQDPGGGDQLAGIMDGSAILAEGEPSRWVLYFGVDDVDAAVGEVERLGGSIRQEPQDSPYGRVAEITDSTSSILRIITPPTG